ncbi:MAG: DUF885 family protein [Vicinamibacterales bacterium]
MGEPAPGLTGRSAAEAALDGFFDTFYRQRPVTATFTGVHAHDDRLPDWSPEGLARARDEMTAVRAALREAGCPADERVRAFPGDVDLALADAVLDIAIAEDDSGHFVHSNPSLWTGEAIFGVLSLLTRDFAPLAERLPPALARLQAVPRFLAALPDVLGPAPRDWRGRAKRECTVAGDLFAVALPAWLETCRAGDPALCTDAELAAWTRASAAAARAVAGLEAWLEQPTTPRTTLRAVYAHEYVGTDFLELLLRRGHWVDTPAADLLLEASDALTEARARLEEMAAPHGGWPAVQEALARQHPTAAAWLGRFHERWRQCREAAERADLVTWPDAPLRYVPFPDHVRAAAPHLYYLHYRSPAPFDPVGTFDYAVAPLDGLSDAETEARLRQWNDSAITLNHVVHHGAIGHHVQNHHAYRGASRIGRVAAADAATRISMFVGGSLAEGWACYACDLMDEIGFLTPLEAIAQQHTRVRLAARAVADLSLHTGRLTMVEASLIYEDQAYMAGPAAQAEVLRNSMFPGAAVMYWLGTRAIHRLRAEVARREGAAFSLRRFHDGFLSYGAIPVPLIARLMLARETGLAEGPAS